jgi:hypothetical protein
MARALRAAQRARPAESKGGIPKVALPDFAQDIAVKVKAG